MSNQKQPRELPVSLERQKQQQKNQRREKKLQGLRRLEELRDKESLTTEESFEEGKLLKKQTKIFMRIERGEKYMQFNLTPQQIHALFDLQFMLCEDCWDILTLNKMKGPIKTFFKNIEAISTGSYSPRAGHMKEGGALLWEYNPGFMKTMGVNWKHKDKEKQKKCGMEDIDEALMN